METKVTIKSPTHVIETPINSTQIWKQHRPFSLRFHKNYRLWPAELIGRIKGTWKKEGGRAGAGKGKREVWREGYIQRGGVEWAVRDTLLPDLRGGVDDPGLSSPQAPGPRTPAITALGEAADLLWFDLHSLKSTHLCEYNSHSGWLQKTRTHKLKS